MKWRFSKPRTWFSTCTKITWLTPKFDIICHPRPVKSSKFYLYINCSHIWQNILTLWENELMVWRLGFLANISTILVRYDQPWTVNSSEHRYSVFSFVWYFRCIKCTLNIAFIHNSCHGVYEQKLLTIMLLLKFAGNFNEVL